MNTELQCRICFSSEDKDNLVVPCDCKGTSSYIHIACLEEYFRHYPDRICRVCHKYMYYATSFDKIMFGLLLIWLSILLLVSNTNILLKLCFSIIFLGLLFAKSLHHYISAPVSIIIISSTLILVSTTTKHIFQSLALIGGILTVSTIAIFVPLRYMAIIFMNGLVALYSVTLTSFFAERNDIFITGCFLSLILFMWAFVLQHHAQLRYL